MFVSLSTEAEGGGWHTPHLIQGYHHTRPYETGLNTATTKWFCFP